MKTFKELVEEVDNIEELNKSTLGSYVKKAAKEYGRDKQLVGRESPDGTVKSAGPEVKRKLKFFLREQFLFFLKYIFFMSL